MMLTECEETAVLTLRERHLCIVKLACLPTCASREDTLLFKLLYEH